VERVDVAQTLVRRDDDVLVCRVRKPEGEYWGFPGGAREAGETLAEAAVRETAEETGLRVRVGRLLAVGDEIGETHNLFFVFEAVSVEGVPAVQDGDPVVELRWLRPEEADELMPWYPNGVRGLVERLEPLYYTDRASGPG
jgi:8-oxo-dGTP diphosphatase